MALASVISLIRFHHQQLKAKGSRSPRLSPWLSHVSSVRSSLPSCRNISPWRWTVASGSNRTYQSLLKDPIRVKDCRNHIGQKSPDPERIILKRSSIHSQIIGLGISVDRRQLEEHLKRFSQTRASNQPPRKGVRFESQPNELAFLHSITIPRTPSIQTWAQFAQSGFL